MSDLKAALTRALATNPALPKGADAPPESANPPPPDEPLPDPLQSEWGALMRTHRVEIPANATLGQLTQRSDARGRELVTQGRKREAERLIAAKEQYLREREREAWARVKARFAALDLPDKAYRALKQEGALPEKVLPRLRGRRGEELRGAGHARVRDALMGDG